jgi:hypothetical protein
MYTFSLHCLFLIFLHTTRVGGCGIPFFLSFVVVQYIWSSFVFGVRIIRYNWAVLPDQKCSQTVVEAKSKIRGYRSTGQRRYIATWSLIMKEV